MLDKLARREAGYRAPNGAPARPRVVLLPGASAESTVLEVRAADRPGLLHAIGSALAGVGVDLRSAHVATHAGQAVDVLYVSEPGGGQLLAAAGGRDRLGPGGRRCGAGGVGDAEPRPAADVHPRAAPRPAAGRNVRMTARR